MNKSESITNLSKALSAAQAEMPMVVMNAVNPFLHKGFADLGAVVQASRPILAKNGLSISQFPVTISNGVGVTSILMHSSGEFLEETISMPLAEEKGKSTAQVVGSIITYLRRYSWSAICGLYADEDTDGNKPATEQAKPDAKALEQPKTKKSVTHEDIIARWEELWKKSKELGLTVEALSPKMTDAEITIRGKELHNLIVEAEKKVTA